jgi:hypothetical protein
VLVSSSLVFLTPLGALATLALLLPLAGLAVAARRERRARGALRLSPPPRVARVARMVGLVAVPVLLGLAATQPALRSTTKAHVRTDAQAFFVVDITRSMLASQTATSPTRLARAKRIAISIRDSIPEVPSGVATLTDRVVPNLFPTADASTFRLTMQRALAIEQPPPLLSAVTSTNVGALGALGTQNYFGRSARHRLVVFLTDGESRGFDEGEVGKSLSAGPGVALVIVHVWSADESVFDAGKREQGYHTNPDSGQSLDSLASATGGKVFGEHSLGGAARAARADLGSGPTVVMGRSERTRALAPYVALIALVPLLLVLPPLARRDLGSAMRLFGEEQLRRARRWLRGRRRPPTRVPSLGGQ